MVRKTMPTQKSRDTAMAVPTENEVPELMSDDGSSISALSYTFELRSQPESPAVRTPVTRPSSPVSFNVHQYELAPLLVSDEVTSQSNDERISVHESSIELDTDRDPPSCEEPPDQETSQTVVQHFDVEDQRPEQAARAARAQEISGDIFRVLTLFVFGIVGLLAFLAMFTVVMRFIVALTFRLLEWI